MPSLRGTISAIKNALRPRSEERATYTDRDGWFYEWLTGGETSGVHVNARTAFGIAAYFACVRNISEDVAALPRGVYERMKRGRREIPDHPVSKLLADEPNPAMTPMAFWETLMSHALGLKGGFAEIMHDANGRPVELWPLDSQRVTVESRPTGTVYLVDIDGGRRVVLPDEKVLHIHGLGLDGITQYALTQIAKPAIGKVLAAHTHTQAFFENGAMSQGILEIPPAMKQESRDRLRESFSERYKGVGQHYKTILLESGVKFQQIQTDPEKSQMVDVLDHGLLEICRLFRMPPHKLQDFGRATWNNISSAREEYRTDCLTPWIKRIEEECARKLFYQSERGRIYVRHNMRAQLRGDLTQQTQHYWQMFQMGVYSINDIREFEDMNPIGPEGDQYFVPTNMESVDAALKRSEMVGNEPEPQPAPPPTDNADMSQMLGGLRPLALAEPDAALEPLPTPEQLRELFKQSACATLQKIFRVENDKAKRAATRNALDAWCERFYAEQFDYIYSDIKPICDEYAPGHDDQWLKQWCIEQVRHSRYHLDEVLVWVAMEARAKAEVAKLVDEFTKETISHG